jgi:Cys-rich repeat protein
MQRLVVVVFTATVMGAFAYGCVGEASAPATAQPGELNGPCLKDNTCYGALICDVVNGAVAKCVADDGGPNDSSREDSSSADAGPRTCNFAPTPWKCGQTNMMADTACYGMAQSCTATGCSGVGDMMWGCFSPNHCTMAPKCCIAATDAVLSPTTDCSKGSLQILGSDAGGSGMGASCVAACKPGDVQLCQSNSQCPAGQICSPVQVYSSAASLGGAILGACVPQ